MLYSLADQSNVDLGNVLGIALGTNLNNGYELTPNHLQTCYHEKYEKLCMHHDAEVHALLVHHRQLYIFNLNPRAYL